MKQKQNISLLVSEKNMLALSLSIFD